MKDIASLRKRPEPCMLLLCLPKLPTRGFCAGELNRIMIKSDGRSRNPVLLLTETGS
jgi:hypothetical protein